MLRPRRVYFDTANYWDLALRHPDRTLRDAFNFGVSTGAFIPVLSFIHLVEIAKQKDAVRHAIVGLLTPHVEGRRVLWARGRNVLVEAEWRAAAIQGGDGRLPDAQVFRQRWQEILERDVLHQQRALRDRRTFARMIEDLRPRAEKEYQDAADSFSAAHATYWNNLRPGGAPFSASQRWRRNLALRMKPSGIPAPVRVRLGAMPANRALIDYETGLLLGSPKFRSSDAGDRLHVACAAYCDVAFVDGNTFKRMTRGGADRRHFRLDEKFKDELRRLRPRASSLVTSRRKLGRRQRSRALARGGTRASQRSAWCRQCHGLRCARIDE